MRFDVIVYITVGVALSVLIGFGLMIHFHECPKPRDRFIHDIDNYQVSSYELELVNSESDWGRMVVDGWIMYYVKHSHVDDDLIIWGHPTE